jgi:site-specific DNA-methyltransferase (adenine-specific)
MPVELRWPGKDDRPLLPEEPPEAPRLTERRGEAPDNLLIHGDNLRVGSWLRGVYEGKVELIYLDPPFATGTRFSLTSALGDGTRAAFEIEAYDDRLDEPGLFLASLAPRLALAHRLLAPEGLLFLHLDARASHGAKLLLDEIFGPRSFRGEIIWLPGNGAKRRSFFSLQHQTILAYSRGDSWVFHEQDPSLREPFAPGSLKSHFRHVDDQGRRFRRRVVNGKEYIYYADEGRRVGSVWADLPAMAAGSPVVGESTGYPTQKPLALLERILLACSRPGALVADLCCGSGTTLVAAQRLGRRWLGCDIGALAVHTVRKRLLDLPDAPFSLLRFPSAPPSAPSLRASASRGPEGVQVNIEDFHSEGPRGPGGVELLDAWSVGLLEGDVFVGQWSASRSRKRRELPLRSPVLQLPEGKRLAAQAYDVLGRPCLQELHG